MTTEILRPNADNNVFLQFAPATGGRYDKVDEETHDGDSTYVYQDSESEGPDKDIYGIGDSSVGAGTITKVTVKIVARRQSPE